MRVLKCGAPGHAGRRSEAGWQDVVGRRGDLPDGPDLADPGSLCGACARAADAATRAADANRLQARSEARRKLRTVGGLTDAEIDALLGT